MAIEQRRKKILDLLRGAHGPLSGTRLSQRLGVSRQVIVQDVAFLKLAHAGLISTARGYVLNPTGETEGCETIFWVSHTDAQMEDELTTIIDLGGRVRNVIVEHKVYGRITVDLRLSSRRDIRTFLDRIENCDARPLKELTDGIHGHAVYADESEVLEEIARELDKKGYLAARTA